MAKRKVPKLKRRKVAHVKALPDIRVKLDSLFYNDGDRVSVSVEADGARLPGTIAILLVAPRSKDLEVLTLVEGEDGTYVTEHPIEVRAHEPDEPVERLDGVLTLRPDEMFFAMYYTRRRSFFAKLVDGRADVIVDNGIMIDDAAGDDAPVEVLEELAMTEDERRIPAGGKRIGTVARDGGMPVQLPVDELVIYPNRRSDLDAFLEETGGTVRRTDADVKAPGSNGQPGSYLVAIDPERADLARLPQMRAWFEEEDTLYGSCEDALRIYALALHYQMRGYRVGVNPRLQFGAAPTTTEIDDGDIGTNMVDRSDGLINVQRAWAYAALWDADARRINIAFLDMGFSANRDFREPAGGMVQCDLEGSSFADGLLSGFRCEPGIAESPPTVGNSFFGEDSWHGNGVVTTAGGVGNNDFGSIGVGGQVVVPMLYRFGLASYAFEMGLGIRKATVDGAHAINISAGYPCRVITNVGIEFNICSPAGRAAFCAAVTAGLALAAALVCAEAAIVGAIPVVGGLLAAPLAAACATATTAVAVASAACFATVLAGDPRGPMRDAIAFATARGVPVVTIAGNKIDSVPPVVRDILDLDERRTERWQIVPAMIPETIVIGAVKPGDLKNDDFYGERVDLWAPKGSVYFAPRGIDALEDGDDHERKPYFGGTSCATPYVTGVVALMQAINRSLDPRNPALSATERAAIPARIKEILTETAFSDATLAATAPDPSGERRNLVNPLDAVKRAALLGGTPDTDALGYARDLNFDETSSAADEAASAIALVPGEEVAGTILTIPGPGALTQRDADFFRLSVPDSPPGLYTARLPLRTPSPGVYGGRPVDGELRAVGGAVSMRPFSPVDDVEQEAVIETMELFNGTEVTFALQGAGDEDNLYKLTLDPSFSMRELPEADRFDRDDPAVNPPESRPDNNEPGRAVHLGEDEFAWELEESTPGTLEPWHRISIPDLNFHDRDDVDWFVFTELPPHDSFGGPGCRAELVIEFGPGILLTAETEDGTVVVRDRPSPVSISSGHFEPPLRFRLEPAIPGTFVEYDLEIKFRSPNYRICYLAERGMEADEMAAAAGLIELVFPRLFPDWKPGPGRIGPERRTIDEAGLILTADLYRLDWAGGKNFDLKAEIPSGSPLRLQLLDGRKGPLAEASSPGLAADREDDARIGALDGTVESLRLSASGLAAGEYLLAVSHGRPDTRITIEMPPV